MPNYHDMNKIASEVKIGSDELCIFPFGNGAEECLKIKTLEALFKTLISIYIQMNILIQSYT